MKQFKVEITETLSLTVNVTARSEDEAVQMVKQLYNQEVYVLDNKNLVVTEFSILKRQVVQ